MLGLVVFNLCYYFCVIYASVCGGLNSKITLFLVSLTLLTLTPTAFFIISKPFKCIIYKHITTHSHPTSHLHAHTYTASHSFHIHYIQKNYTNNITYKTITQTNSIKISVTFILLINSCAYLQVLLLTTLFKLLSIKNFSKHIRCSQSRVK